MGAAGTLLFTIDSSIENVLFVLDIDSIEYRVFLIRYGFLSWIEFVLENVMRICPAGSGSKLLLICSCENIAQK